MSGDVTVLTHVPPVPLVSGERIRDFHLIKQLSDRGWRVSCFSLVPGARPDADAERTLREVCSDVRLFEYRPTAFIRYGRLLTSIASRRAYYATHFADPSAVEEFRSWIGKRSVDAVLISQLFMHPYVEPSLYRRAVLDCHNAEAERMASLAAALGATPRGIAARAQTGAVRRFEAAAATSVNRVLCVSDREAAYFEQFARGRVEVVPNGVDCDVQQPRAGLPSRPTILFMGSMDYTPNVDAFEHLVNDVLPSVRFPGARVIVIGSNPRKSVRAVARRAALPTEVVGEVASTRPFLEDCRLLVVPLRIGAGTRLKILEALAVGIPVVSTSVGCEGLELEAGRDLLVADDPAAFAATIDRLLRDDDLCRMLSEHGRKTVERLYDWKRIGEKLDAVVTDVASGSERAAADGPSA